MSSLGFGFFFFSNIDENIVFAIILRANIIGRNGSFVSIEQI